MQLLDSTLGGENDLSDMLFRLVKNMGFVCLLKCEALFVNKRLELAFIDMLGDFSQNFTLSFAANPREYWN